MLCLLWFCITRLSDWLKNLAPLSQPIRRKTKTNRDLLARQLLVFALISDWFILCFVLVVIGQNNYFGFLFYDTHLKTALSSSRHYLKRPSTVFDGRKRHPGGHGDTRPTKKRV